MTSTTERPESGFQKTPNIEQRTSNNVLSAVGCCCLTFVPRTLFDICYFKFDIHCIFYYIILETGFRRTCDQEQEMEMHKKTEGEKVNEDDGELNNKATW